MDPSLPPYLRAPIMAPLEGDIPEELRETMVMQSVLTMDIK